MSMDISPFLSRGCVVRAFIPHATGYPSFERNLLLHGFVFRGGETAPHAVAASRFSYGFAKPGDLNMEGPGEPLLRGLSSKKLKLRTNRIDIIPLDPACFPDGIKRRGRVVSDTFWQAAGPALENGLKGPFSQASLFLAPNPGDTVRAGPFVSSAVVTLPARPDETASLSPEALRAMQTELSWRQHRLSAPS